jgi:hypothetical protein
MNGVLLKYCWCGNINKKLASRQDGNWQVVRKPGSCFKEALQYRRSNYLYAVITICNPHHNLWVRGSTPLPEISG